MEPLNYHFVGIGGIGMSALATLLIEREVSVSGSDLQTNYNTEALIKKGAYLLKGHSHENIPLNSAVVYNTRIAHDNPELSAAKERGYALLHRSELLMQLMRGYRPLLVTGTHGKTTTSALLAHTLLCSGRDPTFALGGLLNFNSSPPYFGSASALNARQGQGEYFVAEADESDASFLNYRGYGAIITNLNHDHLYFYGTKEAQNAAFKEFIDSILSSEHLFICGDDPLLITLSEREYTTYGFGSQCALRLSHYRQKGWRGLFDLTFEGVEYSDIELPLLGKHNALNAAAVFGLAKRLGLNEEEIRESFKSFPGVLRRCHKRGESSDILVLDDYAHHVKEIEVTLAALRSAVGARRLVVIFQPHLYTRTQESLLDYPRAFMPCDQLYVAPIYSAGERAIPGVGAESIVEIVKAKGIPCSLFIDIEQVVHSLQPFDVVVTLGAGDITLAGEKILAALEAEPKTLKVALIYGGLSGEHEISALSAHNIAHALELGPFQVQPIKISAQGYWHAAAQQAGERLLTSEILELLLSADVLFPIIHGTYGEDGTLQGMCEMLLKPYVGPDQRGAAICMDKALSKKLATLEGVEVLPFVDFSQAAWANQQESILEKIEKELHFPLFVKPLHLGSTLGISKAKDLPDLIRSIEFALSHDTDVLVEEGVEEPREIEFALLGDPDVQLHVPDPGEICTSGKCYDYQSKYGEESVRMGVDLFPALKAEEIELGRAWAEKVYRATCCSGMARVDFFLDQQGRLWFNEINPLPGFTAGSMYPKIWEREGVLPSQLMRELIIFALRRHRQKLRTILKRDNP